MRFPKLLPAIAFVGLVAAACGGGNNTATTSPAVVPSDLSISSFTQDFSYMSKLTDLVKAGKGSVGVILPDTTSSARYVAFDAPYLKKAFDMAVSAAHAALLSSDPMFDHLFSNPRSDSQ